MRRKKRKQAGVSRFVEWYLKIARRKPVSVIAASLLTIVATVGSLSSGVTATIRLYDFVVSQLFANQVIYERLASINTGLHVDFVDQSFGRPSVIQQVLSSRYGERIYAHKKYFLRVIVDEAGIVQFYSITTRSDDFKPPLPLPHLFHGLRLGAFRLGNLDSSPNQIALNMSSKFFYYNEKHEFGNPGFYKMYLFERSDLGCCREEDQFIEHFKLFSFDDLFDKAKGFNVNRSNAELFDKFRAPIIPNVFGVYSATNDEKLLDYVMAGGVSVNFFIAREFP
jgi:hypothetical protein